ncbi:uncharacterized protein LOC124923799 [Impatiens glandulifera]|uniref:uncharacterized protein LOC124923799 n=1 Tax=Impatiens glandulifera TaxID=253017 RepID=UPI001FB0E77F|nr:uncharacterized protein LOC124923799 [Impatiens glandulifera]
MTISSSSPTTISGSTSANPSHDHIKEIKRHEVAIAELNSLHSSRAVYHKQGNIFFRSTVQKATTFEQRQLDALQKLSSKT